MFGPNVFASPPRRLVFVVGRPGRPQTAIERVMGSLRLEDGCTCAVGSVERPGVRRFLRCRTEWCESAELPSIVLNPMEAADFTATLAEEYKIRPTTTDMSLSELPLTCGDEIIVAVPRKARAGKPGSNVLARRYSFHAIRVGHPQCLGLAAAAGRYRGGSRGGAPGQIPEELAAMFGSGGNPFEALFGGAGQDGLKPAGIRITVEVPPEALKMFAGIAMRMLFGSLFGGPGSASDDDSNGG